MLKYNYVFLVRFKEILWEKKEKENNFIETQKINM